VSRDEELLLEVFTQLVPRCTRSRSLPVMAVAGVFISYVPRYRRGWTSLWRESVVGGETEKGSEQPMDLTTVIKNLWCDFDAWRREIRRDFGLEDQLAVQGTWPWLTR
jgi:hypothetical protein